ncbi:hypothetical protein CAOG_05554 [Capsaspora owczarzaki ATCC 30864]|uniref:RING-type domain-containing protein n=1 Tax=Capsaspora owczarzaki (strain ATCC 30864) TaxID=595528 RepID=A0A0D2WTN9_CAPO3|nr:hypothetical protein CAOG_05554 [Capsaspora owczarzaki ATCC 30864]KJE95058.1 hypothetical protein CAOG_005554 [Capsaspora owczarzaki ATCC 30864]|eukprot:XP_004346227.1 hypothetical protein CAOG_05554 [Capsaspora owczarzaki ATCC 30864]
MDWIHCNRCFRPFVTALSSAGSSGNERPLHLQPQPQVRQSLAATGDAIRSSQHASAEAAAAAPSFHLTSCGHILCVACLTEATAAAAAGLHQASGETTNPHVARGSSRNGTHLKCPICSEDATCMELNDEMPPELRRLYIEPAKLMAFYTERVCEVMRFQDQHRMMYTEFLEQSLAIKQRQMQQARVKLEQAHQLDRELTEARSRIRDLEAQIRAEDALGAAGLADVRQSPGPAPGPLQLFTPRSVMPPSQHADTAHSLVTPARRTAPNFAQRVPMALQNATPVPHLLRSISPMAPAHAGVGKSPRSRGEWSPIPQAPITSGPIHQVTPHHSRASPQIPAAPARLTLRNIPSLAPAGVADAQSDATSISTPPQDSHQRHFS